MMGAMRSEDHAGKKWNRTAGVTEDQQKMCTFL